jgi:hypothetical protein
MHACMLKYYGVISVSLGRKIEILKCFRKNPKTTTGERTQSQGNSSEVDQIRKNKVVPFLGKSTNQTT